MRRTLATLAGLAVAVSGLSTVAVAPASAEPDGSGLVINEVYGGGGATSGTPYSNADFVELYNPTDEPVRLSGLSLQYRSATYGAGGFVGVLPLDGEQLVPPNDHFLVQVSNGSVGPALPATPDQSSGNGLTMSGTGGQVLLVDGTSAVTAIGDLADTADVLDMVGYGTGATSYEGSAPTGEALSTTTSAQRVTTPTSEPGFDSDVNATDFANPAAPSPTAADGDTEAPPLPPEELTIAEIQGTGDETPFAGETVQTEGVVTASYPTGGFNGFVIQTGGTGGALGADRTASDAIFVWGGSDGFETYPAVGDSVEVVGTAVEGGGPATGLTQIVPGGSGSVTELGTALVAPTPTTFATFPASETVRETLESMLVRTTGTYTVTNTFTANSFAEIGLAAGTTPLVQPTEVADAQDQDAVEAVEADNEARRVALDDGASVNYLTGANRNVALPYLSPQNPIRVGARATITAPVIMEWRNSTWKFQPTERATAQSTPPATFTNTRTANAAPRPVGGDLQVATFNVLNYFPTTGVEFADENPGVSCTAFDDRFGNPITVNSCGSVDGPRGAWNAENLERQEVKIVEGLIGTGAEVVGLQEIENSARFGKDRDFAVQSLVDALNEEAGAGTWDYVPSPPAEDLPPVADQDVIRNAMIYQPDAVRLVGDSASLGADPRFGNAREPMAQVFRPVGSGAAGDVAMIVNHFKSKGSGVDDGTGQGNANPDRIAQAEGLEEFADAFAAERGVEAVFLVGDFNSYTSEDPMQVLYDAGYTKVDSDTPDEYSYSFSGLSGSLDHVVANEAAFQAVTGSDYWAINGGESVAFEYSRVNYNRTQFYDESVFRSSDHDPQVVGLTVPETDPSVDLNLLSTNDFHGRINNSGSGAGQTPGGTAQYAGTIERLRENFFGGRGNTLLLGNGDLYGASEFTSAINDDVPTFDVMNALGMAGSAVGNHEFDFGFDDLTGRVTGTENETGEPLVDFPYLGANVYEKGTTEPALPEYATYEVDGVTVGVIGVVTQETPALVSPDGITDIDFGNAAEAADRVAAQLSDGEEANGEADVIVLQAHAGGQGFAPDATFAEAIAATSPDSEFQELAGVTEEIDVIFNGHTHQRYALRQPVDGGERPIVQAGQYGEAVGQVVLTYDRDTDDVTVRRARVQDRITTSTGLLRQQYPVVEEVQQIVDQAIADAAVIGNQPVGEITDDITRARTASGGEDRGEESTLGGLIGNALRDGLPESAGTPDLGLVNPGGIRADLTFAGSTAGNPANTDGVVTYAEANTVLPFVNNVSLVDLTGEQLTQVLEQQFQPDGSDRTYLHLGLSDNVQVTTDRTAPRGERITSVRIDGETLDPAATYTVSTFSFLAAGGDNFTAFRDGTARDTGLVDRDVWIGYLQQTSLEEEGGEPIVPDFARRQVDETGLPASLTAGGSDTFTLSRLDMTSLDSPANTAITATLVDGETRTDLGQVGTVTGGTSEVTVEVPADAPDGSVVELVAAPSGTTVTVPVGEGDGEPEPPVDPEPVTPTVRAWANPQPARTGQTVRINARVLASRDGQALPVDGTVVVRLGGNQIGGGEVDGQGRFQMTRSFPRAGNKRLRIVFRSDDPQVADRATSLVVRVNR